MSKVVTLFDGDNAIGVVDYTDNLDHWDGRNTTCGETGRHLGLDELKDGRYYLCHGTQWEGEKDYAEVIDEDEAKAIALKHSVSVYRGLFGEPSNLTAD